MRRLFVIAAMAASLVCASTAQAQTATLSADRSKVAVDTPFEALLTISGGSVQGTPRLGRNDGFQVTATGRETSVQMTRSRVERSTLFRYSITPTKIGKFTLGPFSSRVDGRILHSNTVTVTVVARGARTRGKAAPVENWFIEADVDDDRPFVGESFVYRLRVGSANRSRDPVWGSLESEALTAEPGVRIEPRQYRKLIDSRTWTVSEILVPLFGVEPGPAQIAPVEAVLPVVVAGGGLFARTRDVQLRSKGVRVTVRPLPAEGRPDDFSGAVGSFTLRSSLQPTSLQTGETATLTVVLEGDGAARNPSVDLQLPASLRAYDEDPKRSVTVNDDGLHTRVVFRKALVPLEPGRLELEPVTFSYFEPKTQRYVTAKTGPFTLTVGGAAIADVAVTATGLQPGKSEVELLGSDILALHDPASTRRARPLGLTSPLILLLLLLPLASWGGSAVTKARRDSAGTEAGRRRSRVKEAKAARNDARKAAQADDWEGTEQALRRWISARLGRAGAGAALSPVEAPDVLRADGAPDDLADRLGALLGSVEAARYGGGSTGDLADALVEWLADAIKEWR
jgi:hypothetical protein